MALPASGLITLRDIGFEAAIAQPYTLTKLYGKMGAPASGLIRLTDFYGKSNAFTLTISTSVASPDIHQLARNAGWGGTGPLIVNFSCPYVNSLRLDGSKTFPGGLALNIMSGCLFGGTVNGGTAFYTRVLVSVSSVGTMAGGGGRGGVGQDMYFRYGGDPTNYIGNGGTGGNGQGFANTSALSPSAAAVGNGGLSAVYPGDVLGGQTKPWCKGGRGGTGGNWGQQGAQGSLGYVDGSYSSGGGWNAPTVGAPAGLYVDGNSFVTWGAVGTRLGGSAN